MISVCQGLNFNDANFRKRHCTQIYKFSESKLIGCQLLSYGVICNKQSRLTTRNHAVGYIDEMPFEFAEEINNIE